MPTAPFDSLLALARANAQASRSLETSGMSFSELRLLLASRSAPEGARRPTDLASEVAMTPSGITRALLSLEQRGIVARRRDARDRRASHALLTPAGATALENALLDATERAAQLLRRLSVGQTKQLERLLEEIGR
jgi:DNA-binding MarR family transcriptional regulator